MDSPRFNTALIFRELQLECGGIQRVPSGKFWRSVHQRGFCECSHELRRRISSGRTDVLLCGDSCRYEWDGERVLEPVQAVIPSPQNIRAVPRPRSSFSRIAQLLRRNCSHDALNTAQFVLNIPAQVSKVSRWV